MIFLLGERRGEKVTNLAQNMGWGRMWASIEPQFYEGEPAGFDNGALFSYLQGRDLDEDLFQSRIDWWLANAPAPPMLAAVPDIVAGGRRSLDYSLDWRERLKDVEWPWYLVVQDGINPEDVEPHISRFAGIFLGGLNKFKKTAPVWGAFAKRHGLKFHYGRAGTPTRVDFAYSSGADSCDSSFPLTSQRLLSEFIEHWKSLHNGEHQPRRIRTVFGHFD